MSEEKTLVQKMAEVMAEVGYIQKDATLRAATYSFTYASAEAVLGKVNVALSERGIAVSGGAELVHFEMVDGGKKSMAVVNQTLIFTDGKDSLMAQALGQGVDSGDKAVAKANTSGMKYAVAKAFMISWGDDPEADPETEIDNAALAGWLDDVEGLKGKTADECKQWWTENADACKKDLGKALASDVHHAMLAIREAAKEAGDA